MNCAGEAVKSDNIPTRPTKVAPMKRKKQLIYDSHHSTPQSDFCIPQPPQHTPFIPNMTATPAHQHHARCCATQLHHAPQHTLYSSHFLQTPQRTNHAHHTAPHQSSPNPKTPDAPGVLVLTAEAAAPCGTLHQWCKSKKANSIWLFVLAVGCWLLHWSVDVSLGC